MKQKITLRQAEKLAEKIISELKPGCEIIEVAGSIRRKKASVGDIEIVAIPILPRDLFGNPSGASWLTPILQTLLTNNRLVSGGANGDKYKKFIVPSTGTQLDLFLTSPDCWPVIYAIRTGSADFSRQLVTPRNKGGLLPSDCCVKGGRVWRNNQALSFADEREFLEFCGGWVEPEGRK